LRGFFNIVFRTPLARVPARRDIWTSCPATGFSKDSHFLELAVVKNGGTSLYRQQLAEKQRFSTNC
jgi:hypothetical protein